MLADLNEKQVVVNGTNPNVFRESLKFLYFHEINFEDITKDVLLDICALAHQYDVGSLVGAVYNYMLDFLKVENVLACLRVAEHYNFLELQTDCRVTAFVATNKKDFCSKEMSTRGFPWNLFIQHILHI